MSDPMVDRLLAIMAEADAMSRAHPQGTPDAQVSALEEQFKELERAWIESVATTAVDFAALDQERLRWIARQHELAGTDEGHVHMTWLIHSKRWYKLKYVGDPGPPRPDVRSPISDAFLWLTDLIQALSYECVAVQHPGAACNCAAASAAGRHPTGNLESVGETSDGYYFGTQYECRDCGARWVCWIMDDSVGSARWERG